MYYQFSCMHFLENDIVLKYTIVTFAYFSWVYLLCYFYFHKNKLIKKTLIILCTVKNAKPPKKGILT